MLIEVNRVLNIISQYKRYYLIFSAEMLDDGSIRLHGEGNCSEYEYYGGCGDYEYDGICHCTSAEGICEIAITIQDTTFTEVNEIHDEDDYDKFYPHSRCIMIEQFEQLLSSFRGYDMACSKGQIKFVKVENMRHRDACVLTVE